MIARAQGRRPAGRMRSSLRAGGRSAPGCAGARCGPGRGVPDNAELLQGHAGSCTIVAGSCAELPMRVQAEGARRRGRAPAGRTHGGLTARTARMLAAASGLDAHACPGSAIRAYDGLRAPALRNGEHEDARHDPIRHAAPGSARPTARAIAAQAPVGVPAPATLQPVRGACGVAPGAAVSAAYLAATGTCAFGAAAHRSRPGTRRRHLAQEPRIASMLALCNVHGHLGAKPRSAPPTQAKSR